MHEVSTSQKVGLWIDHRKTVFVFVNGKEIKTAILDSDVGPHARYSSDAAYPTPSGDHKGGGEKKYEERNRHELERYYDEVIKEIGHSEAVFIFGPGEAKTELKSRMTHTAGLAERVVGVESADKLTDGQIEAKVKEHFNMKR